MKTIKIALVLLLSITFSMTVQAKKVNLRYTLEKGFEVSFKLTSVQEIVQELMGQSQSTQNKQILFVTFKVLDVDQDGNYTMSRLIPRVKILASYPSGDMEFDTDNVEDSNPMADSFVWLTETPTEFVMSPEGNILKVIDSEKIADEFVKKFSGEGVESQMIMAMASQFTTEDGLKQSLGSFLLKYPDKKVKVGQPWESVSEMKLLISFKNTASTKIKEMNKVTATLSQSVMIEQSEVDNVIEMQGMEMEYELSGEKQGSYEVNLETGLIIHGEESATISGLISVDSPQLPAPMTIPMTIKSSETISRIK